MLKYTTKKTVKISYQQVAVNLVLHSTGYYNIYIASRTQCTTAQTYIYMHNWQPTYRHWCHSLAHSWLWIISRLALFICTWFIIEMRPASYSSPYCQSACILICLWMAVVGLVGVSEARAGKTRQLSYGKEDRAMHPIYGCTEKFPESSLYAPGYFSRNL